MRRWINKCTSNNWSKRCKRSAIHVTDERVEGILLVDKPKGVTSFSLVHQLRKLSHIRKIGHAGTLDPFATGVMVMLIGKAYTRLSDQFLCQDKEYLARLHLGAMTDTFDIEGQKTFLSDKEPTLQELEEVLAKFQGTLLQIPPMFSAKKVKGKKLYELARAGKTIERQAVEVQVACQLLSYSYPFVDLKFQCSKGTYVRSLAHDIGQALETGAYLEELTRLRSGPFSLSECVAIDENFRQHLRGALANRPHA
ncbi:MAG: tRNA pseudouridine(55) synthase TruB [Verrucomicrobia bacterium]|nr:tRNA pseudouridine(55) synthase TruB [Verrucomicrobiota bacterium]